MASPAHGAAPLDAAHLERFGLKPVQGVVLADPASAAAAARQLGFPVAVKIASPDILHKTDVGGVRLDLRTPDEVEEAARAVLAAARAAYPQARLDGVRVEAMCRRGVEVIIGMQVDPQFGPVMMLGLGGIFTDLLGDVSFRVIPFARADALAMIEELQYQAVLAGFRGEAAVSQAALAELLLRVQALVLDLGDRLQSLDLNPVRVWGEDHRVLDWKAQLTASAMAPSAAAPAARTPDTTHLDELFNARTVAVVGASATPGKVGHAILASLVGSGFTGTVYPVNPHRDEIMGLRCYPSLAAIPGPVDLVVVAVPLTAVPELLEVCPTKGVRGMVIVSGGGREIGGEAAALEARIGTAARQAGVRVIGPNCIGVFNGATRLDTFFQTPERMRRPPAGPIAVLTQSGTVGCAFAEHAEVPGVSKLVSYGNRLDVDEADLLAYLQQDPATRVVAAYVEGFADGAKFARAARALTAAGKPLVVYKPARTRRAASASVSHTGHYGGSYAVARGALRQAGAIEVDAYEELVAAARALAMQPPAVGPRVAFVTNGAGPVVQAMDHLAELGLVPAELGPGSLERLRASSGPAAANNPVDLTGSATSDHYATALQVLQADPGVDLLLLWFVFQDTPLDEGIVERLQAFQQQVPSPTRKPILAGALGGPYTRRMQAAVEAVGVPVVDSVEAWLAAARALARWGQIRTSLHTRDNP